MDNRTIKSLLMWLMIIAFCGVLMTFSFYIVLFALPLFFLIALILLPINMYRSLLRKIVRQQNTKKSGKVIDVDCEVIKSEKNN